MAFTNITSTDEVRAVLGVSPKELLDSTLAQPFYTTRLTEDIRDMHPSMLTDYATYVADTGRTDDQQRFVDLLEAYAAYHIARQCLGSVAMFAPMLIDAGNKSMLQRVADPYAQLKLDVPTVLGQLKARLRSAYAVLNTNAPAPTAVERLRVLVAPLGTDPITG